MRRIMRWSALVLGLTLLSSVLLPTPAAAQVRYWVQAVGDNGDPITSGVLCRVLTAGANTEPTIYTTSTLSTAAANPITGSSTTGECSWWGATGTTYDVAVYVNTGPYKGGHARLDAFTSTSNRRAIVSRAHGLKVAVISFTATASSSPTSSAVTLPAGTLLTDAFVETKTAVATSLFNVGLTNPVDDGQICANVSTATVGFVDCNPTRRFFSTSRVVTYYNQNHASAGYVFIYYRQAGNEP